MKSKGKYVQGEISSSRRMIFNLILVLSPFLLILLFETTLRVAGYGNSFRLFIDHPDAEYKGYKVVNPEIGKKYFRPLNTVTHRRIFFWPTNPIRFFAFLSWEAQRLSVFPTITT